MGQLDMAAKEAMFTKERMTGEAGAKSQKLTHLAAEKARLLGEVGRLTGERETLLRNRENYDSEEFALRNEISSREEASTTGASSVSTGAKASASTMSPAACT